MDAVRAADRNGVAVLLRSRGDRPKGTLELLQHERTGVLHRQRERRVDHVGRGQAEMEPAPVLTEGLGHCIDEGGHVVTGLALDLGHPVRPGSNRAGADPRSGIRRHDAELRPGVECGKLHLEPTRQPRLIRPDPGHRRAGVARNHRSRL